MEWWAPVLLVGSVLLAYSNSIGGAFVMDDPGSILDNLSVRKLWPLTVPLSPPAGGRTVSGRPILNLSLAINYAVGGSSPVGYHVANILIHCASALLLWGILSRLLKRRAYPQAGGLALGCAALWALHPLQTESVTYVVQRAESLMGLFFLGCFYCLVRSEGSRFRALWEVGCGVAFCLGVGVKENMVAAAPLLLLFDRAFLTQSWREVFLGRRVLVAGIGIGLGLFAALLVANGGNRGGSVGVGVGVPFYAYALTQPLAILTYLRLSVVPYPLVFEYGTYWPHPGLALAAQVAAIMALMALSVWLWIRAPRIGFIAAWFFLILAPTSLAPGTTQMIVEHRMYLPLAAVIVSLVLALARWLGAQALASVTALAIVFGVLTWLRNEDYASDVVLWRDTVSKRPDNDVARNNLGAALARTHSGMEEALAQYRAVLQHNPGFALAHNNLGNAYMEMPGRLGDAVAQYEEALRLQPDDVAAHANLGNALSKMPGRLGDAIAQYEEAIKLKPTYAGARSNLAKALLQIPGRQLEAIEQLREAIRLNPDFAEAHNNLGEALALTENGLPEAVAEFRRAIELKPDLAEARNNLGNALAGDPSRRTEAVAQLKEALRLNPLYSEAHNNLGNCWIETPGRLADAISEYGEALKLRPDYPEAHFNLAIAYLRSPDGISQARVHLEAFLRLRPDNAEARQLLMSLPETSP